MALSPVLFLEKKYEAWKQNLEQLLLLWKKNFSIVRQLMNPKKPPLRFASVLYEAYTVYIYTDQDYSNFVQFF